MLGAPCSPCCGGCKLMPDIPSSVEVSLSGGLNNPAYAAATGFPVGYGLASTIALWCRCEGTYELSYLRYASASDLHDYYYQDDEVALLFRVRVPGARYESTVSLETDFDTRGNGNFWNWCLQLNTVRWRQLNNIADAPRKVFSKSFITSPSWNAVSAGVTAQSNAIPTTLRDTLQASTDSATRQIQERVVSDQVALGQGCDVNKSGIYRSEWSSFGSGGISYAASVRVDRKDGSWWAPDLPLSAGAYRFHNAVMCDDVSVPRARFRVDLVDFPEKWSGSTIYYWYPPADISVFPDGQDSYPNESQTTGLYIMDGFPAAFSVNVDDITVHFDSYDPVTLPYACPQL